MTRFGQIGADSPFTDEDRTRMATAMIAILEAGGGTNGAEHDVVNLAYGRDFLTENKRYDVVIVHSVFDSDPAMRDAFGASVFPATRCSPQHSYETWRRRLVDTGAEWIVVCEGQPCCLSGWQIGELEGYERLRLDTLIAVYRKGSNGQVKGAA
ncbi:hypothetical protein LCGC14_1872800 [marine sediment metagenome]|uniref:Uncharacterized protein n=1 Tax=marine sediment metagenome TaxID=412755 RepID=A0A0F9GSK5_9ZZZZ